MGGVGGGAWGYLISKGQGCQIGILEGCSLADLIIFYIQASNSYLLHLQGSILTFALIRTKLGSPGSNKSVDIDGYIAAAKLPASGPTLSI